MPGKMSIRERVMSELGITSNNAKALINGYARNHGRIDADEIINSTKEMAKAIVNNIPYDDAVNSSFRHEVIDCGKERKRGAIREAANGEYTEVCLPSYYADDTEKWASAVFEAARTEYKERVMGHGIEGFRTYIRTLPFDGHSLNYMAEQFGEAGETAEFIAKNGTKEEFSLLMTEVINYDITRSCPRTVSDMVYDAVKENGGGRFNRREIMRNMSAIHQSKALNEKEKKEVQQAFLSANLAGRLPNNFYQMVKDGEGRDTLVSSIDEMERFEARAKKTTEKFASVINGIPMTYDESLKTLRDMDPNADFGNYGDTLTFTSVINGQEQKITIRDEGLDSLIENSQDLSEKKDVKDILAKVPDADLGKIRDTDLLHDMAKALNNGTLSPERAGIALLDTERLSDADVSTLAWIATGYMGPWPYDEKMEVSDEQLRIMRSETENGNFEKLAEGIGQKEGVGYKNAILLEAACGPIEENKIEKLFDCIETDKRCCEAEWNRKDMQVFLGMSDEEIKAAHNMFYSIRYNDTLKSAVEAVSQYGIIEDQKTLEMLMYCLRANLPENETKICIDQSFNGEQRRMFLIGFESGFDMTPYADHNYNAEQLEQVVLGFRQELSKEQMDMCFSDPNRFSAGQMQVMREAFGMDLNEKWITLINNPSLVPWQMEETLKSYRAGLTPEEAAVHTKPEFNERHSYIYSLDDYGNPQSGINTQAEVIRDAFIKGVPMEKVLKFAKPEFSYEQMYEISTGLREGLPMDRYADSSLDACLLHEIHRGLEHGLTPEDVDAYAKDVYNTNGFTYQCEHVAYKARMIREGLEENLPVKAYSDPSLSEETMMQRKILLECGVPAEEVEASPDSTCSCDQLEKVQRGVDKGLTLEEVCAYWNRDASYEVVEEAIDALTYKWMTKEEVKACVEESIRSQNNGLYKSVWMDEPCEVKCEKGDESDLSGIRKTYDALVRDDIDGLCVYGHQWSTGAGVPYSLRIYTDAGTVMNYNSRGNLEIKNKCYDYDKPINEIDSEVLSSFNDPDVYRVVSVIKEERDREKLTECGIDVAEYEPEQIETLSKLIDSGISQEALGEIADPDNPADKMERMGSVVWYEQGMTIEAQDVGQEPDLEYAMTFTGDDISDDYDEH